MVTGQHEFILPSNKKQPWYEKLQWPLRLHVLRIIIWFIPVMLFNRGLHYYLWSEAEKAMPPVGYVFPREPPLKGIFHVKVGIRAHGTRTYVDGKQIICQSFSFYDGTFFQYERDFSCDLISPPVKGRQIMRELEGKEVEVHSVYLPLKNKEITKPIVVKIISEGTVYRDFSDKEIRNQWIRDTNYSTQSSVFDPIPIVFSWLFSGWIINRFFINAHTEMQ